LNLPQKKIQIDGANFFIALPCIAVGVFYVANATPQWGGRNFSAEFIAAPVVYAVLAYFIPRARAKSLRSDAAKFGVSCLAGFLGLIVMPIGSTHGLMAINSIRLSSIKQMSLGYSLYLMDYDGRAPKQSSWASLLQPYTKNDDLMGDERTGWVTLNAFQPKMEKWESERSVLFYYSTQSTPNPIGAGADPFWVKETEVVSFGDGSAERVTESEFGALSWMGPHLPQGSDEASAPADTSPTAPKTVEPVERPSGAKTNR